MNDHPSFGQLVREHRRVLDLTQAELARRVACATITIRKIEADALRPSKQIAERLAMALNIPLEDRARFVALARSALRDTPEPSPLPTPAPTADEIGTEDLSGRAIRGYELGERIGVGGFGAVYRAVQPLLEREVAIKIVLPQYANHPDFIRRFEAEAQLVARLEHPYIVPLYDYWREPGVAYLVMRLMRGGSLRKALKQGALGLDAVTVLLEQVGAALHAAHRVGVIHRDLKPDNVMLDEEGNGYLADFGIAKNLSDPDLQDLTQVGALVGSPAYTSPEQIRDLPVRPQADIYSLGLLLYELLTGRRPFTGPTPIDYIQQHLQDPLPPLTDYPALDAVVQRATAKEPLERFPDVPSLLGEFRQAAVTPGTLLLPQVPYAIALDQEIENPYKGLRPFVEADAEDFYGRETLVQELLGRMGDAEHAAMGSAHDLARFLAVVGPSGSGKSSAVKAGLIPALRRGGLPGSEQWFIVDLLPGGHPFEELEASLLRVAVNPPERLLAQLREDERGLLRAVRRVLPADPAVELVLVIDQFEEVFTLLQDAQERQLLLDSLVTAVMDERSRVRVMLTLRADFVGRALEYVDFGELVRQRTAFVLPLTPDELEMAIAGPAARVGLALEPGLVATIVGEVGDQPGMLPLLQYALTELFEQRQGRVLTLGAYRSSGGVLGALSRRAEEVYEGLDAGEQDATRQLFLRLVTLGEGREDTRRRVLRSELETLRVSETHRVLDRVIDAYGRYRLLTFDRDPLTRGPTVEVAHEALLREWPRLRGWLDESRADVRMERSLAAAAQEWAAAGQEDSFLVRGARLTQFEGWAETSDVALTEDERAYLAASVADRERREMEEAERQQRELEQARRLAETERARAEEQARSAARLGQRAAWLAVLMVIAVLAAVAAGVLGNQARIQADEARQQARVALANKLAAQSLTLLDEQLDLGLLLGVQAYNTLNTVQTRSSLLSALQYSPGLVHLLRGHTGGVLSVALSPDGRIAASGSQDSTVRLWDAETGQPIGQLDGHTSEVSSVAFSPDGRILASCGRTQALQQVDDPLDNAILLWDVETGQSIGPPLAGYPGYLNAVAFSPDGRILASGGCSEPQKVVEEADLDDGCTQGQILLWDVEAGQPIGESLTASPWAVKALAFSPDGLWLASASCRERYRDRCSQGEIVLWNIETGQAVSPPMTGHGDWVTSVAYSPDGKILASGSQDATVRLWDISAAPVLSASEGLGASLADDTSGDETSLVQPLGRPLVGHGVSVESVAFNPDGRTLASGGGDHAIRLWDVGTGRPIGPPIAGHTSQVTSVVYSPDGETLVSGGGSPDNSVRLWDPAIGGSIGTLFATYPENFVGVAFSPDGKTLAAGGCKEGGKDAEGICSGGGVLHLWDISDGPSFGQRIVEPIVASDTSHVVVVDEAFSPDGTILVVNLVRDGVVCLWDTSTWQPIGEPLTGHDAWAGSAAFSPDGRILATGDWGGTIRLWDVASRQPIGEPLTGHTWGPYVLHFMPDGETLVSSGLDGTVRRWDVGDGPSFGQPIGEPITTTSAIIGMDLSPDRRILATGHGHGGTDIILWDTGTWQPIGPPLTGHTGDVDWLVFSPDGRTLVSSSADTTIRLWDVGTGRNIGGPLIGHLDSVLVIAISPDGKTLASSSWDGSIRLWDLDPESWAARVCQIAGRNLTQDEWALYLPDTSYEKTCPQWLAGE